jgi:hypothetical protein
MELDENFARQLQALGAFRDAPQVCEARHEGRRLACGLRTLEAVGCEIDRLALESDGLALATVGELERLSGQLASAITYLLEPIGPVEVDPFQALVQLRSKPPQRDAAKSSYFELIVRRGGEVSLQRYEAPRGQPRRPVPAQLTREALLRLTRDLAAIVP